MADVLAEDQGRTRERVVALAVTGDYACIGQCAVCTVVGVGGYNGP